MTANVVESGARTLVLTCRVDAPRARVFRAFTEPEHVIHWWGPFGFRNTIHELSVRPGGRWRFTMHGPDGTDYPNEILFREVEAEQRLAYRHSSCAADYPAFDVTITFAEEGPGTRVTLRQIHPTEARAAEVRTYAAEGGRQTLTRLEGYLGTMREALASGVLEGADPRASEPDFVFTRVFAAPRELLFRAMTEAAHLDRWFGPAGMGLRVVSSELRPGGQFRYAMTGGPSELFGRFVYREVATPARLAYVVSFTDESGALVRHPLSPSWPLEVLTVVTLTEFDGRTLVFGRSLPLHAPLEERQTFLAGHPSMVHGVGGMYDRLDAYLTTHG